MLVRCLILILFFFSCNNSLKEARVTAETLETVRTKIQQRLDIGDEVLNATIDSIGHKMENIFVGRYHFYNSLLGQNVRVTAQYTFSHSLDSILRRKQTKIEKWEQGKWVDSGLIK